MAINKNKNRVARKKTQKNGKYAVKINNSMNTLSKINNSLSPLCRVSNSMTPLSSDSMNPLCVGNDSMITASICADFTWEIVDRSTYKIHTPYTSKGALELLSTEELSATYLNTIITLIHQKGSCFGIDCYKCPLSIGYMCSQSTPSDRYTCAVKYMITTYGESATKEMITEALL